MPQNWPAELPQQFDKDGYQDAFSDNRLATGTDLGPALIRSRYTAMPRRIIGVMKMHKWQLNRLRDFWRTDTLDGKLPFIFPDPVFGYGWRRNWVPNSGNDGAVSGNPGTFPLGWSGAGYANGIYRRVAGFGLEAGMEYTDFQLSGTPTGTGVAEITFATAVAAAIGEPWTLSAYTRMVAGSKQNLTRLALIQYSVPVTGNNVSVDILGQITTAALAEQRHEVTWEPVASGMTGISPRFQVTATPGIFMDITVRLGGIQLEKAGYATDFMPTPNDANPICRFAANGRPPMPTFLGGDWWAVNMELELFEK
jgi:hypothetical protein